MSVKKSGGNPYRDECVSDQSALRKQSSRRNKGVKSIPALFPTPLTLKSEARRFKSLVV